MTGKTRPTSKVVDVPRIELKEKGSSNRELPADVLDVFSPLKRKDVDSENTERKEKRMKESSNGLDKSTRGGTKRFSTVIDSNEKNDKTKEKLLSRSKRDDIRSKEREMDKEAVKALSTKSSSTTPIEHTNNSQTNPTNN
jgi:hypothetical protein